MTRRRYAAPRGAGGGVMAKTLTDFEESNANWRTCYLILGQGAVDGAHHKQWVLDRVLRRLAGADYPLLIEQYEQDGSKWDTGIAP